MFVLSPTTTKAWRFSGLNLFQSRASFRRPKTDSLFVLTYFLVTYTIWLQSYPTLCSSYRLQPARPCPPVPGRVTGWVAQALCQRIFPIWGIICVSLFTTIISYISCIGRRFLSLFSFSFILHSILTLWTSFLPNAHCRKWSVLDFFSYTTSMTKSKLFALQCDCKAEKK